MGSQISKAKFRYEIFNSVTTTTTTTTTRTTTTRTTTTTMATTTTTRTTTTTMATTTGHNNWPQQQQPNYAFIYFQLAVAAVKQMKKRLYLNRQLQSIRLIFAGKLRNFPAKIRRPCKDKACLLQNKFQNLLYNAFWQFFQSSQFFQIIFLL